MKTCLLGDRVYKKDCIFVIDLPVDEDIYDPYPIYGLDKCIGNSIEEVLNQYFSLSVDHRYYKYRSGNYIEIKIYNPSVFSMKKDSIIGTPLEIKEYLEKISLKRSLILSTDGSKVYFESYFNSLNNSIYGEYRFSSSHTIVDYGLLYERGKYDIHIGKQFTTNYVDGVTTLIGTRADRVLSAESVFTIDSIKSEKEEYCSTKDFIYTIGSVSGIQDYDNTNPIPLSSMNFIK